MKKKGYRSNLAKAVWIALAHLTAVAAVICAVMFAMIYAAGIRLEDRGKSYIESEGFYNRVQERGTDILESLSAREILDILTRSNTNVIDLDEFRAKGNNRDALLELSMKNTSGVAYSVSNLIEWAKNYKDFYTFYTDSNVLDERFKPQGADSLADAVNASPLWKGRLDEAQDELYTVLDCISSIQSEASVSDYSISLTGVYQTSGNYEEGTTNLTYLFADKDTGTVYTNKQAYSSYAKLEQSLKQISEGKAYAIVYPKLEESVTNIAQGKKSYILQVWNYTIRENFSTEDFVFAVSVDTAFPVEDAIADEAQNYEKYADLMLPVFAGGILSGVLFIVSVVWLTVVAGRKPEDEKIHLNSFDGWYTEIAAGTVIGVWGVGILGFGMGVANAFVYNAWLFLAELTIGIIYTMAWFLIGYLSLIRRIKAGTLWKNSLLRKILKWTGKCNRKMADLIKSFSRNTSEKLKMLLLGGGFLFLQFMISGIIFSSGAFSMLLLLLVMDAAAMFWVIQKADGQDFIMEGLEKISSGELQYKIRMEKLRGKQKKMAEYINNIGDGLDAAVENSLKKERMQTELITNVSHDLKTPLTSIINYVDLLKRENISDKKIQEYLRVLDEKSQRLKVLTEDVVEASKASTGNIKFEMADVDFVEMVQQVIGEFEEKFQEKNLVMMVHFSDEPSVIYADGQRMWRVLENIFGNVVKYAMEGTRVYAEVSNKNNKVIFSLKNISAQPLNFSADELTERFIRGDVSRNTEGSGLGLSIAKSLTELQGGEFKLYLDGDLFKIMISFIAKEKTQ